MSAPQCCLCGRPCEPWHPGSSGYGHNPDPLGGEDPEARCCTECNETRVIPARLKRIFGRGDRS